MAAGLLGAGAFLVRPELLVFSVIIPVSFGLLGQSSMTRKRGWQILGYTLGYGAVLLALTATYFHSSLPLAFYTKTLFRYDAYTQEVYRPFSAIYFWQFYQLYQPLFFLIFGSMVLLRGSWLKKMGAFDIGTMVAISIMIIYYRFFVLQVMGMDARFYFIVLPALIVVATKSTSLILATAMDFSRPFVAKWSKHPRIAKSHNVLFACLVGTVMLNMGWFYWSLVVNPLRLSMTNNGLQHAEKNYATSDWRMTMQQLYGLSDNASAAYGLWYGISELHTLPPDTVVAATDVGLLGIAAPQLTIVDIVGLNETHIAHHGFDTQYFFTKYNPDLIYLPHPDNAVMNQQILSSKYFREHYKYYSTRQLGSKLPVAIRKDSPSFVQLQSIFSVSKVFLSNTEALHE